MTENAFLSSEKMKEFLDSMAVYFNTPAFIETDPVQFPRRYKLKQDIEISAFLTATIAWGKRNLILKSAEKMHEKMGASPYDYIMGKGYERLGESNIHRTFFESDMAYLCRGLHAVYLQYDSCEWLFSSFPKTDDRLWKGISAFRELIFRANENYADRSLKHISNPAVSACKRLHLALRWLVRNDGIVDIGLWRQLLPSELFMPLDVHVAAVARKLGLLTRKQNDRKAVEELTANLRCFNPVDPVIYDFALFGVGEKGICN